VYDFKRISMGVRSNPMRAGRNFANRLVNCFAEENGEDNVSPISIWAAAGLRNFGAQFSADGIRKAIVVGTKIYLVSGRSLFMVDVTGIATLIGGIPTDGPVYMMRNRANPTQIGIVSDGSFWIITNDVLTQINDVDLPAPNSGFYHDGYFIFTILDGRWFISAIDDGDSIDGLDFAKAESNPDDLLCGIGFEREIVLFGTKSIEWDQNTGGADFPYTRSQTIDVGCLAGNTVAAAATETANALFFVANDHTVRRINGYTPTVISPPALSELIRVYAEGGGNLDLMSATSWEDGGRFFYSLSCPQWTWVYDTKSGWWHERKSYLQECWRVNQVLRFGTKLIACDYAKGQLYEMSSDIYSDGDDPLITEITLPTVHMAPYRFSNLATQFDFETGVGLGNAAEEHDKEPIMRVDISRDGGKTYHGHDELRMGRKAETQVRAIGRLYGQFDQRGMTLKLTCSAAVMRRFDQAWSANELQAA
jgi:hypothetical protein